MMKYKRLTTKDEEGDIEEIAFTEDWAEGLIYCEMEGFAILEDGSLVLLDECGNCAYCPSGRFSIIPENSVVLTREELKAHDKALAEKFAKMVSQAIVDNTYPYFDKDGKPVNIWKAVLGYDKIDEIAKEITEGDNG